MNLTNVIAERKDKTIYRDGNSCIKCFDENYSKANILNEATNHTRIEESIKNVPKLISVSNVEGKWAITTEFIEGRTLEQIMKENTDKIEEYMETFTNLHADILSKHVPRLDILFEKVKRKIKVANLNSSVLYNISMRLETLEKGNKVCHGDFVPSNIILGNDGKCYVLDWSHVSTGNPIYDIATTYLIFKIHKRDDLAKMYLDKVCQKLDISEFEVKKWLPIASVVQLTRTENAEIKDILMNYLEALND